MCVLRAFKLYLKIISGNIVDDNTIYRKHLMYKCFSHCYLYMQKVRIAEWYMSTHGTSYNHLYNNGYEDSLWEWGKCYLT